MKMLLCILMLTIGLKSFSQLALLRGEITDSAGMGFIQDAELRFLKNDTTIISSSSGTYKIELSKYFIDTIVVSHWKYGSVRVPISLRINAAEELNISFPVSCKSFPKTNVCPKCKTNGSSIRIIYGFPSDELFERAERGEIKLGGCMVNDCMPYYHCRKDAFDY